MHLGQTSNVKHAFMFVSCGWRLELAVGRVPCTCIDYRWARRPDTKSWAKMSADGGFETIEQLLLAALALAWQAAKRSVATILVLLDLLFISICGNLSRRPDYIILESNSMSLVTPSSLVRKVQCTSLPSLGYSRIGVQLPTRCNS